MNITVLPQDEIRFVKTISVVQEIGGVPHRAEMIYLRRPASDYKMKQASNPDENLYYGIKEEQYPSDIIDDLILEGVKKVYSEVYVRTSLLLFNTELDHYKRILPNFRKESFTIQVNPHIDDIEEVIASGKVSFPVFFKDFLLYCFPHETQFFQNGLSILEYAIDKETEITDLWNKLEKEVEFFKY